MNYKDLDKKAQMIATNYKRCERELVTIISCIDRTKAFYKLGHSSLFAYMTKHLGLSEAIACNISAVVRKSYEVPELQKQVASGRLSLSKARKLTPVINKQNQKIWLDVAKNKNQLQIEREVSMAQPKAAIPEKVNYIAPLESVHERVQIKQNIPRLKLELGVSEKLMIRLRRCQDLESQRKKRPVNLEECLETLVEVYLEKKDPVRRAERQKIRGKLDTQASVSDTKRPLQIEAESSRQKAFRRTEGEIDSESTKRKREPIPAKIKHQVQLRDRGRCSHRDKNGVRCNSRRHLEIHHINPVRSGGDNSLENLRLLCHGHHKMQHLPVSKT